MCPCDGLEQGCSQSLAHGPEPAHEAVSLSPQDDRNLAAGKRAGSGTQFQCQGQKCGCCWVPGPNSSTRGMGGASASFPEPNPSTQGTGGGGAGPLGPNPSTKDTDPDPRVQCWHLEGRRGSARPQGYMWPADRPHNTHSSRGAKRLSEHH